MKKNTRDIVYTGTSDLETEIIHYRYHAKSFEIIEDLYSLDDNSADLIVVEGFKNQQEIINLTKNLAINDFFVEDIFNVNQRNKYDVVEDQIFIVLKYPLIKNNGLEFRYISFLLKKGLIITFTDYENVFMTTLLDRLDKKVAIFTSYDESYIVYAIYDMIIDQQLDMAIMIKQDLDELEASIMETNSAKSKDLFSLHKNLVQLRNNAQSLSKNLSPKDILKSEYFNDELTPFITDLEDHIFNLIEKLNTSIEICNSLITMYSTQISNKTNEVMKTLTIISVIFIPLSFIAGVFGMNFTTFEILNFKYGLLVFIGLSLLISLGMLWWFKHKKWL